MDIKSVQTSYARWAPVYDKSFGALTSSGRRSAVDYINARQNSVLEVGVGTGLSLAHYHGNTRVTGIDFSAEMLEKARRKVAEQDLHNVVDLRQMDARNLDFPDASFDTVAAMHVLSVVPEPERVMCEIARVTKPGGKVVITNHFTRRQGVLGTLERLSAPFANVIGWHSDFEIETVLQEPDLVIEQQRPLPPMGMMTLLVLEKKQAS
ncbi:class I SAM-dependent methyltransferase [Sulfitobacter aestuarii]|uniref:Class I SAM-dependent methyltransferase n=1 Tax=Sulfitobacter aestuarii TaxID=2161676 RepID=A0ABW5U291_9RHOB